MPRPCPYPPVWQVSRSLAGVLLSTCTLLFTACGGATGSATPTVTTVAPWSSAPDSDRWARLDMACAGANDQLLDIARTLLPLESVPLANRTVAEYRREQAELLRDLVPRLRTIQPPTVIADDWDEALDGLEDWAGWADELADDLDRTPDAGMPDVTTLDQTPPPGLEEFRRLVEWGSCSLLLDVN